MSRISTSETILSSSEQQTIIKTTTNPPAPPPTPPMTLKNGGRWVAGDMNRPGAGVCSFRLPRSSSKFEPVKFLRRLGAKLAKAMRMMSMRKQRSSCKVSSSSSAALARSRSCADPITDNSHRAEAIGDCIEFLNSSSLQRSNSVSSSCT